MKKVYIMRGIPGSGKSTYANKFPETEVCSADSYFYKNGHYSFDKSKLDAAHRFCKAKYNGLIACGDNAVVDNTNTTLKEFEWYISEAKKHGYAVEVVRMVHDLEDCIKRNVHSVPEATIRKMNARFQDYPGETLVEN